MITRLFLGTVDENFFKITTKLLHTKDTCTSLVFIKWVSVAI